MKYKIVADSSANLLSCEGADFSCVPLKIVTDEKEYVDDASLNISAMLSDLEAYQGKSGTSCPSVGDWLEAFGDSEGVFTVSITSSLSGCYNAAVQAREIYLQNHPDRQVCCLDTLSTGPEMALIVEKLQQLVAAGLEFAEIEAQIRDYMHHTHLLFMLESMNNLAKNGRVSPLIAKAVGFLGIRIVGKASSEGTLEPRHKCRGEKKGLEMMVEELRRHDFRGGKARIAHCDNEVGALTLKRLVLERFPEADITIAPLRGLCCFYGERGCIMLGFED